MFDRSQDSSRHTDSYPFKYQEKQQIAQDTPHVQSEETFQRSYLVLLAYAALFGVGAALLTAGFLIFYHVGVVFFEQPEHFGINVGRFWPLVLLSIGGLLVGLAIKITGEHARQGVLQRQYSQTGQVDYRYLPSILLVSFLSLFSGASIGPEAPLVFLTGGLGSYIARRSTIKKEDIPILVYSAMAGCFGGFFGSPVVGAIAALEYMFIREVNYYRYLIPGLLAASFGYGTYWALLHTSLIGIYSFPSYTSLRLIDLGWAFVISIIAGCVGILVKLIFGMVRLLFVPLASRPVLRAVIGGVVIGLIGSFVPLALYAGQTELQTIIQAPAAYGALLLLLLFISKALLTSLSFSAGFEGGPVFPFLFMGGTLGLALSKLLPFIPQGLGVTTGMAAFASALFPIPLTIALLLGLLGGQPNLTPTITIGAIVGCLITKILTPLLPEMAREIL